jgi:hypothetical protein
VVSYRSCSAHKHLLRSRKFLTRYLSPRFFLVFFNLVSSPRSDSYPNGMPHSPILSDQCRFRVLYGCFPYMTSLLWLTNQLTGSAATTYLIIPWLVTIRAEFLNFLLFHSVIDRTFDQYINPQNDVMPNAVYNSWEVALITLFMKWYLATLWTGSSAVCDIIITFSVVFGLHKNRTGFKT